MRKGIPPQLQWISYVTQSRRLIYLMMRKIHNTGKVYHSRSRRQRAQNEGLIAKYNRRFGQQLLNENGKGNIEDFTSYYNAICGIFFFEIYHCIWNQHTLY
ncbi:hypothetical protein MKX01_001451 [Papaver californicum]|nr:hypothetical protein MKX01_001451 [Papaver californicum]